MRFIVYILLGAGAAIAIVALAVVLLDDGEQATIVAPQTGRRAHAVVAETTAQDKAQPDDQRQPDAPGVSAEGASAVKGRPGNPSTAAPPTGCRAD